MTAQRINRSSVLRLRNIDWDFAGSPSDSPFSSIHWHPGRVASQLPAALIGLLTEPDALVLDPFAGSGTTLTEAQRLNRRGYGIELNPISYRVIRAKVIPRTYSDLRSVFRTLLVEFQSLLVGNLYDTTLQPVIPATVQRRWYHPRTLFELGKIWERVRGFRGDNRLLAEAAFSAILLSVCRERRHWGYVCDNVEPKGNYYANAKDAIVRVLSRFDEAYHLRDLERLPPATAGYPSVLVIHGDARDKLRAVPDQAVSLVLTSPPYFGVSDYAKAQRLSFEWFSQEIEPVRRQEIGARSKRHRRSASRDYLAELSTVFSRTRPKLARGGLCAVLIGESPARAPVVTSFLREMKRLEYRLQLKTTRAISVQRRQNPSVTEETLAIFSLD